MAIVHERMQVLPSAARVASPAALARFLNHGHRGIHVVVNVTALTAAPSVVVTLQGVDAFGATYDLLVGTAITATGKIDFKLYPGIGQLAGRSASDVLPSIWTLGLVHGNADSITYTVSAELIP